MTCKDCISYEVCENGKLFETPCIHHKNKADFVEVVRCKDCKNFIQKGEEYLLGDVYGFCERSRTGYFDDGAEVYGNDFCSYGVKGGD